MRVNAQVSGLSVPETRTKFGIFVNRPVTILEIGVQRGGSLQMWKRYVGPHARIVGIDSDASCKAHEEDQIDVRIGGQQDEVLQAVVDEFVRFDIVLDDGAHVMSHITTSFRFLYPRMEHLTRFVIPEGVRANPR